MQFEMGCSTTAATTITTTWEIVQRPEAFLTNVDFCSFLLLTLHNHGIFVRKDLVISDVRMSLPRRDGVIYAQTRVVR